MQCSYCWVVVGWVLILCGVGLMFGVQVFEVGVVQQGFYLCVVQWCFQWLDICFMQFVLLGKCCSIIIGQQYWWWQVVVVQLVVQCGVGGVVVQVVDDYCYLVVLVLLVQIEVGCVGDLVWVEVYEFQQGNGVFCVYGVVVQYQDV